MTYLIPQQPGSGGVTLQSSWRFSTTTAAADPGTRTMRYNDANPADVTELYINDTNNEGFDASTILGLLSQLNRIYVQQQDDAANATLFELTGPAVDNTGWWTVPVSVVSTLALPVNNKACAVIMNLGTGAALKTKIIEIGDWDMDADQNVSIAHGLNVADIRAIKVLIRHDDNGDVHDFHSYEVIGTSTQFVVAQSANVFLNRATGGQFDGTTFNATSFNRGWITIWYV